MGCVLQRIHRQTLVFRHGTTAQAEDTKKVTKEDTKQVAKIPGRVVQKIRASANTPAVRAAISARDAKTAKLSQIDIDRPEKTWRAEVTTMDRPFVTRVVPRDVSACPREVKARTVVGAIVVGWSLVPIEAVCAREAGKGLRWWPARPGFPPNNPTMQRAAGGTTIVSGSIERVTEAASKTGDRSVQVIGAADRLARESARLIIKMANFINQIRAA